MARLAQAGIRYKTLNHSPDIGVTSASVRMGSLQLGGIAPGGNRVTSPTEHLGGI